MHVSMGLISRQFIESVKDRVNIYDVVAPYVTLKRTGSSWKGLSPFSQEKTPSFFVLPEKGIFKCFSSGLAGDLFRFLQLKEKVNFQEAVEMVAERFNLTIEYEKGGNENVKGTSLKKMLLEIHEIATDYFHKAFLQNESIQSYWINTRGFTLETAKRYKIGFAKPHSNELIEILLKKHFSAESLIESGLFYHKTNESNPKFFKPRFNGRLMIPIRDIQARVVAFAGRKLEVTPKDDPAYEAKYINSPETPLFHKGETLFGLDVARQHINDNEPFILVEGQLDTIRCAENGFKVAVAPQGTAITEQQLYLLKRYSQQLTILLDADEAGRKAALRVIPMAIKIGIDPFFVSLPPQEDPDTFLRHKDPAAFKAYLEQALPGIVYMTQHYFTHHLSPQQKSAVLKTIFSVIALAEGSFLRQAYLDQVVTAGKLDKGALMEDFQNFMKTQTPTTAVISPPTPRAVNKKLTSVEYELIMLLLNYDDLGFEISRLLEPDWVNDQSFEGKLLLRFLEEFRENTWQGIQKIDSLLETEEEYNFIYNILSEEPPFDDPLKVANSCLKNVYTTFIQKKIQQIDDKIKRILNSTDSENIRNFQTERMQLRRLLTSTPQITTLLKING